MNMNLLKHLVLTDFQFEDAALSSFANSLQNLKNLMHLDLTRSIKLRGLSESATDEFFQALAKQTKLQKLVVNRCLFDRTHWRLLMSCVEKMESLQHFEFVYALPPGDLVGMELMITALPPTLQYLDLSCNVCQSEGSPRLSVRHLPNLKHLNLTLSELGPGGMEHLASALASLDQLTFLSASMNGIGDDGVRHLSAALPALTRLQHLDLSGNLMGDDGLFHLAECLPALPLLRRVSLEINALRTASLDTLRAQFPAVTFTADAFDD